MRKTLQILLGFLLSVVPVLAQTTTVTGTIVDSDSQNWSGATVAFSLFNPSHTQLPVNCKTGLPVTTNVSTTTNSSGVYSASVSDNSTICPVGTRWTITLTPNATSGSYSADPTRITGASQTVNFSGISAPRFTGVKTYGYTTSEVSSPNPGDQFYNVASLACSQWNGTSWDIGCAGQNVTAKSIGQIFYSDQYATGTTDCGISEAANAAAAAGSFLVQLPAGVCNVYTAIVPKPGVTYRGYGGYTGSGNLNNCGTILEVTQSDLFDLSSANSNAEVFEGFCAWSRTGGGGHIFNDTTGQSNVVIRDFYAIQANTNKAVYYSVNASGTVTNVLFENGYISVPAATALPMIDIQDPFVGNVTLKDMFIQNSSASTAAYNVLIKSTTNTNSVGPTLIKNVIIEPPPSPYNFAGAFQIQNEGVIVMDSVFVDDLLYTAIAPTISITPDNTLSNGTTSPITIIGLSSIRGSTTYPDLYVAHSSPSQVNIIGSNLGWIGGDSGNPFNYANLNSTIQNSHDATQVLFANGNSAGASTFAINGDSAITAGPRAFIQADTGNLTSIVASGQYDPVKAVKAGTIENIVATASAFTCTGNPTITLEDCGTSAGTCASSTALGSATVTAANTSVDGTIINATITAGHYLVWETTAGTCTALNISGSAEYRMN